jgi:hypothetical protein
LWKGSYIILTIVFVVMAGNVFNFLILYGLSLLRGPILLYPAPYTGCMVLPNTNTLWITFASTLAFEALSTSLIIYKSWPLARLRGVQAPLFTLLWEDGIAYCLSLVASKLFVIACLYLPSVVATVEMPTCVCISVSSLVANRLILRLQATVLGKTSKWTDYTTAGFSIARNHTGGREIITIGGSGKTGPRVHARRHSRLDNELLSLGGWDVELSLNRKEGGLHITDSTSRSSASLPTSTTSGSSSNMDVPIFESKPCDAV